MNKPSIPKGTRDFTPLQMRRRNYIFGTIQSVFQLFGYEQIETPAMENLSTLMGKYGQEGDKLLFKILNSGEWRKDILPDEYAHDSLGQITSKVSEKGLRYDLTVPFARYVVQHQNELVFPFKRYQMQPVWRADRPQKGRYREFYQCDVDVIGTNSLLAEVELIQIIQEVYKRLNIGVKIHINNRKVLAGIAEYIGCPDKLIDITVALDKLDKIGVEKVREELVERGLSANALALLEPLFSLRGDNATRLAAIEALLKDVPVGSAGVNELHTLLSSCKKCGVNEDMLVLDLTLARGLNYYTGAIFEVKATETAMGSITGGGRYDNLTGIFGLPNISGVGISFGADRIYDVLETLQRFPEEQLQTTQVLFVVMGGEDEQEYAMQSANFLREKGIRTEIYLDTTKVKKQMAYANAREIPFVAVIGEEEREKHFISLKNMRSGEQTKCSIDELYKAILA